MNQALTMAPAMIEIVNGTLLIVCIGVALFFGCYIVKQLCRFGVGLDGYVMSEGAIAMFVFVIGDAMVRGSVWYMRHQINDGLGSDTLRASGTLWAVAGVIVATFGGLCIIRIFAPKKFGAWPWIITLMAALAFSIGFAL